MHEQNVYILIPGKAFALAQEATALHSGGHPLSQANFSTILPVSTLKQAVSLLESYLAEYMPVNTKDLGRNIPPPIDSVDSKPTISSSFHTLQMQNAVSVHYCLLRYYSINLP